MEREARYLLGIGLTEHETRVCTLVSANFFLMRGSLPSKRCANISKRETCNAPVTVLDIEGVDGANGNILQGLHAQNFTQLLLKAVKVQQLKATRAPPSPAEPLETKSSSLGIMGIIGIVGFLFRFVISLLGTSLATHVHSDTKHIPLSHQSIGHMRSIFLHPVISLATCALHAAAPLHPTILALSAHIEPCYACCVATFPRSLSSSHIHGLHEARSLHMVTSSANQVSWIGIQYGAHESCVMDQHPVAAYL
eukprot:1181930-Prorocentrum_minimum.AAC.5